MKMEHANLTVRSIDEAVSFLKLAFPGDEVRGEGTMKNDIRCSRWVHFGNDESYVALQENSTHNSRGDVPYVNDGINHVGFVVDELDELMSRMEGAGFSLAPASALNDHPHRRRAYYFDGNGIEWEFVEYLSADPQEKNDYTL